MTKIANITTSTFTTARVATVDSAKAARYSQMLVALAGNEASPRPALNAARQRAARLR